MSAQRKVLIVEDEPAVLANISSILRRQHYDVREATNGEQGYEIACEFKPDLIVSDIMMPVLDGYGLLSKIRAHIDLCITPFLFLSAKNAANDIRAGMEIGADDYLTKPFRISELLAAVEQRFKKHEEVRSYIDDALLSFRQNLAQVLPYEIRSALNSIVGPLDLVLSDPAVVIDQDNRELLKEALKSAKRIMIVTDKILLAASLEAGMSHSNPDYWPLRTSIRDEIADTAVSLVFEAGRTSDLKLTTEECQSCISREHLAALVAELVQNAIKFAARNTALHVELTSKERGFILRVSSAGRGLAPDEISDIGPFQKFSMTSSGTPGLGLGLFIVRKIADFYSGTVDYRQEEGAFNVLVTVNM